MTGSKPKARTGVEGLDDVLAGGLSQGNVFLLEGEPGAGKTTVALQFLLEGARNAETGLYIALSESEAELRHGATSHGWDLKDPIHIYELTPQSLIDPDQEQSLLYSADLELGEATARVFEAFHKVKPKRVVLDSLSEIRLLAQGSLRYRRQILAIKQFFARHDATVLLLDDLTSDIEDKTVHSIAHGVIRLEELAPNYGAERRRLRIMKYRGQKYRGGYHDFMIDTGGLRVFPRLVAGEARGDQARIQIPTDYPALNALLGGGIESGSSTLIMGPAGTGKSLIAVTFTLAAIKRGEKAALFIFDEELGLLFDRMNALNSDLAALVKEG